MSKSQSDNPVTPVTSAVWRNHISQTRTLAHDLRGNPLADLVITEYKNAHELLVKSKRDHQNALHILETHLQEVIADSSDNVDRAEQAKIDIGRIHREQLRNTQELNDLESFSV